MLKLEAGKRYWRRDGGLSGPLQEKQNAAAGIRFYDEVHSWYEEGVYYRGHQTPLDLVREYAEPQPLEWKRGIPTEEECRECWIVEGGVRDFPNGHGDVYAPEILCFAETQVFSEDSWYLPLRIKPVEPPKPKTRTVTQRKYVGPHCEELWTHLNMEHSMWRASTETRTVEVPCE